MQEETQEKPPQSSSFTIYLTADEKLVDDFQKACDAYGVSINDYLRDHMQWVVLRRKRHA